MIFEPRTYFFLTVNFFLDPPFIVIFFLILPPHMSKLPNKRHQCEYCQKYFAHKSDLRKHIRSHTNDKPYQCEYCQRCFARKGTLSQHILIHISHSEEKAHQCEYCQKTFRWKSHLTEHTRCNTGRVKPY